MDDLGVAGLHGRAGQPLVVGQLGVEQEAPVVVGAGAERGRGGVRRGHRQRQTPLARTERLGLGRVALVAVPARRSCPLVLVGGLVARALAGLGRRLGGARGDGADRHAVGVARVVAGPARGERERQDGGRGRRWNGSARRPCHRPSGEHVQMGVEDSLTRGRAGVEHEAVLVQTIGAGHVARDAHQPATVSGSASASDAASAWCERGTTSACVGPAGSGRGRPRPFRTARPRRPGFARDDPAEQAVGVRGPGVRHDSSSHGHAEVNPQSRSGVGLA